MRGALQEIDRRLLPHGWRDVVRQLALFVGAYLLYQLVRGVIDPDDVGRAIANATRVIDLERELHVFVEPGIQDWTRSRHWLMDAADAIYLNAHYTITIAALVFLYLRRNGSFYFVRNMFMIAMALALVGYAVYPTAPPRLMPAWGFTDPIQQFTGISLERGATSELLNLYAAIPSMHVCFSLMIAWPMARLCRRPLVRVLWRLYPLLVMFVVVATANHYIIDVVLGVLTAGAARSLARLLLARARPDSWSFGAIAAS
jgi:hypothetical protein